MGLTFGVPDSCFSEPCGLILDLHPTGWDSSRQEEATGMQKRGNATGYIVLQPSAPAGTWAFNASEQLRMIMDALIEAIDVDASRAI